MFNPRSPKQVKELFYGKLKMKPVISRATHKPTTDEKALQSLRVKYPQHEKVISLMMEHREKAKLLDSFLGSKLSADGRLVTSYNGAGTVTGRLTSQKTIFGYGANVQQTPRGTFRKMFIAPKGKKLIKIDLSQADARAVAWFAQITPLVERFLTPEFDIHSWTASLFYGKPENEITKEERTRAKGIVHGVNYGRGPISISKSENIPVSQVRQSIRYYKSALPQLEIWHERIKAEICRCRRLVTPFGRLRIFMGRLDDGLFRSAYAYLPQSIVADIVNKAFYVLKDIMPEGCYVLLQVHDELVIEAPDRYVEKCCMLAKKEFELPIMIPPIKQPLVIPSVVEVGDNWYDVRGIK